MLSVPAALQYVLGAVQARIKRFAKTCIRVTIAPDWSDCFPLPSIRRLAPPRLAPDKSGECRMSRWIAIIAGIIVLLIAIVVAVPLLIPSSVYQERVVAMVKAQTGRDQIGRAHV